LTAPGSHDHLLQEIAKNEDHAYFDILVKNEPGLSWLDFAAKLYRRSHSTNTITSYCKGICAFREMLLQSSKTLMQTIEEIRAQASLSASDKTQTNSMPHKLLDDFVTWCDAQVKEAINKAKPDDEPIIVPRFSPRTTGNYFGAVVKLFAHLDIDIDDRKLKETKSSLPQAKAIKDEIPSNADLVKIENNASQAVKAFIQIMRDTGFDPVDVCGLKVKDVKFDETPARINKDREKTGEALEGFLSQGTVDTLTSMIKFKHKQADDYLFTTKLTGYTLKGFRDRYNLAVAKAGFGTVHKQVNGRKYMAIVDKIDGHKFGKYHLKVFKKRWFTLVVSSGIAEYVAQGMLGRKQYLDEYMRLSLDQKRQFATKILRVVSLEHVKKTPEQTAQEASALLGMNVDAAKLESLKGLLASFHAMPKDTLAAMMQQVAAYAPESSEK
jgi:hypothetical protein